MEIYQARENQTDQVHQLTARVIREVFPFYYPGPVVDFFLNLHGREQILEDIRQGKVYLLRDGEEWVGTGTWPEPSLTDLCADGLPEEGLRRFPYGLSGGEMRAGRNLGSGRSFSSRGRLL